MKADNVGNKVMIIMMFNQMMVNLGLDVDNSDFIH